MNDGRDRRAHENSTMCMIQQGGRGSTGRRGTKLTVAEAKHISMADIALERFHGGGSLRAGG